MIKNIFIFISFFIFILNSNAQKRLSLLDSLESKVLCNNHDIMQQNEDVVWLERLFLAIEPRRYGEYLYILEGNLAKLPSEKYKAEYLLILGTQHFNNKDYSNALKLAEQANLIGQNTKDTTVIIQSLILKGALFNYSFSGNESGNPRRSIEFTQRALDLSQKIDWEYLRMRAFQNLAFSYMNQLEFEKAKELLLEGINETKNYKESVLKHIGLSYYNNLLGVCYRELGSNDLALGSLNKSLQICDSLDLKGVKYLVNMNIGLNYIFMKKYELAFESFLECQQLLNYIAKNKRADFYKKFSSLHERMGNYDLALTDYKNYSSIVEEVKADERLRDFRLLEEKLENEKNTNQVKLLTLENNQIQLAKKKTDLALTLITVFMCILAILLYFLWKAKQKEKLAIKKKDLLYSIVSHDLRSPVVGLKNVFPLLKDALNTKNVDKIDLVLKHLASNITVLYNLIENLINWTKINFNNKIVQISEFILDHEILNVIDVFESQIIDKKLKIELSGLTNVSVVSDRVILSSVIRNVLSNAIKFSNDNGKILVTTQKIGLKNYIEITDFGIGIRPESQAHLFEVQDSLVQVNEKRQNGLGIGLYISKKLINSISGDLVYVDQPNRTVFRIEIIDHVI